MCERRTRKIRKGSHAIRQREARRLQRLTHLASPPTTVQPVPVVIACQPTSAYKNAQCRLIIELAWKTIALMQKHNFIQQKIVALRRETSEFIAAIMSNPENRRRYCEHVRLYRLSQQAKISKYDSSALMELDPKL